MEMPRKQNNTQVWTLFHVFLLGFLSHAAEKKWTPWISMLEPPGEKSCMGRYLNVWLIHDKDVGLLTLV